MVEEEFLQHYHLLKKENNGHSHLVAGLNYPAINHKVLFLSILDRDFAGASNPKYNINMGVSEKLPHSMM